MIAILAISIRRSWGLTALPLFLGLELLALFSGGEWSLEWGWTTSWMNGILVLLGPAVAAVAAAESVHLRRRSGGAIRRSTWSRAVGAHLARASAVALWAGLAHVIGLSAAWTRSAVRHDGLGMLELPPIVATLLLIVAWACAGSAAGWALPWLATPIAVAVFGYLVPALQVVSPGLFLLGARTAPMAGLRTRPVVVVALSLLWLCVALAAVLNAGLAHRRRPRPGQAATAALSIAAVVLAGHWAQGTKPDQLASNPSAARTCMSSQPTLCAYEEHATILEDAARIVTVVSSGIERVYGHLPTGTVLQLGGTGSSGVITLGMLTAPPWVTRETVALDLFTGWARCDAVRDWNRPEGLALLQYAVPLGFPADPHAPAPQSDAEARQRFEQLRHTCQTRE